MSNPVIPLAPTANQRALWLLDRIDPGSPSYNLARSVDLRGPLDLVAFAAAIDDVAATHSALRTRFDERDGGPVRIVVSANKIAIRHQDLSQIESPEDRASQASAIESAEARLPIDLGTSPLMRVTLIKLGGESHRLVVVMHHIISDDWSIGIFWRELERFYELHLGRSGRPETQIVHCDALEVGHQGTGHEESERPEDTAYWRAELAGLQPLVLPKDSVGAMEGGSSHCWLDIGVTLSESVREFSRRTGVSTFDVFLAAFQLLVSRLSGQEDFAVGVPVLGRRGADLDRIGYFANVLVVRTNLANARTFDDMLRLVHDRAAAAYEHGSVSVESLVRELMPDRLSTRNPLFQVLFTKWSARSQRLQLCGQPPAAVTTLHAGAANFDVSGTLIESDGQFRLLFDSLPGVFGISSLTRFAARFRTLLQNAISDPTVCSSDIELRPADEVDTLVHSWSRQDACDEPLICIHELISRQAARTPDAVAIRFDGAQLTYAQLDSMSTGVAGILAASGVRPNRIVAFCVERSLEMMVGVIGILKAGGAFLPLVPSDPRERARAQCTGASAEFVVTSTVFADRFVGAVDHVFTIDDLLRRASTGQGDLWGPRPQLSDLAYVIHTSGTTGKSKAVAIEHHSLANHMAWMQRRFPLAAGDRVLQKTSLGFDASVWELFSAIAVGATLVVASEDVHRSPAELLGAVEANGIDVLQVVPSMLEAILSEPNVGDRLRSLRRVFCGGEPLYPSLAMRFAAQCPATLINLYGPAEATIDATFHVFNSAMDVSAVPIGRPIANAEVYILDEQRRVAPIGVVGELHIGGLPLARGYLNDADLTAARFVNCQIEGVGERRLYKTGDYCRFGSNGDLEFAGRRDRQRKIRGVRFECGEIEELLLRVRGVEQAAVEFPVLQQGSGTLIAYVAGKPEMPNAHDIRLELERHLPDMLVPRRVVILDRLPLSPNGKIDRKALPAPGLEASSFAQPRTLIEQTVLEIWRGYFPGEPLGIDDNFFFLGGHSIQAAQCLSQIERVFGVRLPLKRFYDHATTRSLAAAISESIVPTGEPQRLRRILHSDRSVSPLTQAQRRLWFIDHLGEASRTYHINVAWQLSGAIDWAKLRGSLESVIDRHDVLRSRIRSDSSGVPSMHVVARDPNQILEFNVEERHAEACTLAAKARLTAESHRTFDLANEAPFRAVLLRSSVGPSHLMLCVHHVAFDGWSADLLAEELSASYASAGRNADVLELTHISYIDYAIWESGRDAEVDIAGQIDYWKRALEGVKDVSLPTVGGRNCDNWQGSSLSFKVPPHLVGRLSALAKSANVTLNMTVLAAFKLLLYRFSGQTDITVGIPVAGRSSDTEKIIGCFVNTIVIRSNLSAEDSFLALLDRVRRTCVAAYSHQDVPFESVVQAVNPERAFGRSPLVNVMFAWQIPERAQLKLPGLSVVPIALEADTAKFDLTLSAGVDGNGALSCEIEYRERLYGREMVAQLGKSLLALLESIAEAPGNALDALAVWGKEEREQLLVESNSPLEVQRSLQCMHTRFVHHATDAPHAVALALGGATMTYGELDRRVNQLAHHLRHLGVEPGHFVGICLDRSFDLVIAIIAVLKAGGAYVPLDPAYPPNRLEFILKDADIQVLLTDTLDAGKVGSFEGTVVNISLEREHIALRSPLPLEQSVDADSTAYLIYTSGSTGTPKGVVVTHGNVDRLLKSTDAQFRFGAEDCWLLFHSFSFDFSVWEIWGALAYGGKLVLATHEASRNPSEILSLLHREGVTVLNQTPSAFRQLASVAVDRDEPLPPSLRYVIFGGEALDPSLLNAWVDRYGDDRPQLINMYGITETTVHATYRRLTKADVRRPGDKGIGVRLSDLRIYIVDQRGEPVPPYVAGEIWVGGAGVANGYLNRADLTAQRFIADPFCTGPGARVYRSGDIGRWQADGSIDYLGRSDAQHKIRGFRIELGEVEFALKASPLVKDAVALVCEHPVQGKVLVAYVIPATPHGVDATELTSGLSQQLPQHMVPTLIIPLDRIPINANGKLDRAALPSIESVGGIRQRGGAESPPINESERQLCEAWTEVLGVSVIDRHANFFKLGGHSLLAVKLIATLRRRMRIEVPVRSIFDHPVLSTFSLALDGLRARKFERILRRDPSAIRSLSWSQRSLWMLDQLDKAASRSYNIPIALKLAGEFSRRAMEQALADLRKRHEMLRTLIEEEDDDVVQRVGPISNAPVSSIDLGSAPYREIELLRSLNQLGLASFEFDRGCPWRATILRVNDREHIVHLSIHHIIVDGRSIDILLGELGLLYSSRLKGEELSLPDLPVTFGDYAQWQNDWLGSELASEQVAFWRGYLAGAPTLHLPCDPARDDQDHIGAEVQLCLGADVVEALRRVSREGDATLFMSLLSCWALALRRVSGQDDLVIGTPVENRQFDEVRDVVGPFAHPIPLRVRLAGEPSFPALLARVRSSASQAYSNQDLPFGKIVQAVAPARRLGHNPIFQALISLGIETEAPALQFSGLTATRLRLAQSTAHFHVALHLHLKADNSIAGTLNYATLKATPEVAGELAREFESIVAEVTFATT